MMQVAYEFQTEIDTLAETLKEKIKILSGLCSAEGINNTCFSSPNSNLEYFRSLPLSQAVSIGESCINYVTVCEAEVNKGGSIRDGDYRILWRILHQLGLRPRSQFFSELTFDHSVEVYNKDFIQVYRNMRFMELCSYSFEEIFTYPLKDLFERDAKDDEACFSAVGKIFSSSDDSPGQLALPPHLITERRSTENRKFKVSSGFVASLLQSNRQIGGFVACLAASPLSTEF